MHFLVFFDVFTHAVPACCHPVCATQNATNQPHRRKENENNHLKEVTKLRFRMPSGSIWFISFCLWFSLRQIHPWNVVLKSWLWKSVYFGFDVGFSVFVCVQFLSLFWTEPSKIRTASGTISPTCTDFIRKQIFPYCQVLFSGMPAFTWLVLALAHCFPNKFYEHAMCIGCYQ